MIKLLFFSITLIIFSCAKVSFQKGKYKYKEAFQYKKDDKTYYVIKHDKHYTTGKFVVVTEELFNQFYNKTISEKEDLFYKLQSEGRRHMLYYFNTVKIKYPTKNKEKIKLK